jgi:dihydroorotate dehydrogenase subfamily 2
MLYRLLRPFLFALPPEVAHSTTLAGLKIAHHLGLLKDFAPSGRCEPIELLGLRFPNRLGLAAGLDKNGHCIDALGALGFGFIEVGTVTPLPQAGNPKPRLFRLIPDRALINGMGFPNDGAATVCRRLGHRKFPGVCGINIGKNAATPIDSAVDDYLACLSACYSTADYIAINISSPNTHNLRSLQQGAQLRHLLGALVAARQTLRGATGRQVPLLVKLTVDLDTDEMIDAALAAVECGIDGVIASNSTVHRDTLTSTIAPTNGGLSGAPLFRRSVVAIGLIRKAVGEGVPIIGVGGVGNARDALEMRAAGADLIQVYTALIYRGPALIREIVDVL